jgi:pimeloyl-ACP methyl ester carboxylesterase
MKSSQLIAVLLIVVTSLTFTSCFKSELSVTKLKTTYANGESQFTKIKGMDVHFRDEGPERARTILLLHDKGSSLHAFDKWADTLKLNYRVIRLDLPGFGLTGPHPENDYSMTMYRDFLDGFLAELGIRWCYAVGNGLGGQLAWELTLAYPKRVKKLVLIGAEGYPITDVNLTMMDKKAGGSKIEQRMFRSFTSKKTIEKSIEMNYGDPTKVTKEQVKRQYDLLRREGNRKAYVNRANHEDYNRTRRIKEIEIPSMIMWGTEDKISPIEHASFFHRDLPDSKLKMYPDVGHYLQEEIPSETAKDLIEFLRERDKD